MPIPTAHTSRHRSGIALILALGMVVMIAALILMSSEGAVSSLRQSTLGKDQLKTQAALDAVLARRERRVIELAESGEPAAFADWTENYGLEYFGECEVRWKVEPVRSAPRNASGDLISFISNPSPDINWGVPGTFKLPASTDDAWKDNASVYLFRVAAEARLCTDDGSDKTIEGETLARAQGARYVAVNKEPLFRYVIFYAQKGPKGDLELSHGPAIKIFGNVHSNGSIYLGGGTGSSSWVDARPSNGDSIIGPMDWSSATAYGVGDRVRHLDASSVYTSWICTAANTNKPPPSNTSSWTEIKDARIRVTGVDGIFCLHKPLMYGFFNSFDLLSAGWTPSGSLGSYYRYLSGQTPLDDLDGTIGGSSTLSLATRSGAFINPYRVLTDSQLVTMPATGANTKRRINGTPITGDTGGGLPVAGNDSRDRDRATLWKITAPKDPASGGFSGFARSRENGGQVKQLPETLVNRPLEAQALAYPDMAAEPTTSAAYQAFLERGDQHADAKPVFVNDNSGTTTTTYDSSLTSNPRKVIESPGQYVRYALGSDALFFQRNYGSSDTLSHGWGHGQGFIGWKVTSAAGSTVAATALPDKAGLIIRERPVPDFRYFGFDELGNQLPDRTAGHPDYVPYAYGKHKDITLWPFTEMCVSSGDGDNEPGTNALVGIRWSFFNGNPLDHTVHTQTYQRDPVRNGSCVLTTVVRRGGKGTSQEFADAKGDPPSYSSAPTLDKLNYDPHGFYRDNWRLIHLKRVRPNVSDVVAPVVDLTKADNFFNIDQFTAVETEIVPDAVTGKFLVPVDPAKPNHDPIAGLMVRPFNPSGAGVTTTSNLSTTGLNGRDPFVALCFAPERGIVLQRRFERSAAKLVDLASTKSWYVGTGDYASADTRLKFGLDVANRKACISQHIQPPTPGLYGPASTNLSASVTYYNKVQDRGDVSAAVESYATVTLPSIVINTGEGPKTRPSYTFAKGPRTYAQQRKYRLESNVRRQRSRTTAAIPGYEDWKLSGHDVDFQQTMDTLWATRFRTPTAQTFWIGPTFAADFSSVTATTTSWTVESNLGTSGTPGTAGFVAGRAFIDNLTYRRPYTSQYNSASTITKDDPKYGPDKAFHKVGSPWTDPNAMNGTVVIKDLRDYAAALTWYTGNGLDENDLQAAIKGVDGAVATFANKSPLPVFTNPSISASDFTSGVFPAGEYPAVPLGVDPPDDYIPGRTAYTAGPYKFAIFYGGLAPEKRRQETNAWISARGRWQFGSPFLMEMLLPGSWPDTKFQFALGQLQPDRVTTLPTTRSWPPEVWNGAVDSSRFPTTVPSAAWTGWTSTSTPPDLEQVTDADGSVVYGTVGYNPTLDARISPTQSGTSGVDSNNNPRSPQLWEDTQIPLWIAGVSYVATDTTHRGDLVLHNGDYYECLGGHVSAAGNAPGLSADWGKVSFLFLRIQRDPAAAAGLGGFVFKYFMSAQSRPSGPTDHRWRTVCRALTRNAQGTPEPSEALTSADSQIPAAWPRTAVIGLCVQSNAYYPNPYKPGDTSRWGECNSHAVKVTFAGMRVETSTADATDKVDTSGAVGADLIVSSSDWESAAKLWKHSSAVLTGRVVDNLTSYLCSQYQVFWGPVEITEDFFSYTKGASGTDDDRIANEKWFYNTRFFWSQSRWWNEGDLDANASPVQRSAWVEKETGTTTAVSAADNLNQTSQRQWMARTTVLDLNLEALHDYLRTRTLANAGYRWSTNDDGGLTAHTQTLASRFSGLIYAARTNRYPRNPTPLASVNPWNPDLPNVELGRSLTDLVDLYDGLKTGLDSRNGNLDYGIGAYDSITDRNTIATRLCAANTSDRAKLAAPIPWEDFHHGIMLSKGSRIDWGWVDSSTKFGTGKTSIVTPNALYVRGNLNSTKLNVTVKGGTVQGKWTPLAIMGDHVTLLSGNWTFPAYQNPGLSVNSEKRTGGGILARISGAVASNSEYRTCILTNNQPTNRYRAFQGEGAPFVNTMLFLEDWGNSNLGTSSRTMDYTGSLVVLDSCRYTRGYLLADPRTVGRSPFGLMGWHCNTTPGWSALTGWAGGTPDWCKNGSGVSLPNPSTATNPPTDPYGSPPVYWPPSRNMTFNDDLLTEEGTPPNTPFGVTASGVGGWTRVVQ